MGNRIPTEEIQRALENDRLLSLKPKSGGSKPVMRGGICPECNRKSVWIDAASPWVLRCDHEGTCGYNETIKERYPELFENWGKRYPSTDDDPKATARAYMRMKRGFESPTVHTWYEQGTHKMENGRAAETVRFELVPGMTWERLIEDEHITQDGGGKTRIKKQNPKATYSGACWMPPGMQINKGEDVFIVEGIFCAIAMHLAGKKAVAAISSANFPRNLIKDNKDKNICWCLAYDNEPGAHKHMKRYAEELRGEKQRFNAYLIEPGKGDWNDSWLNNTLTEKFIEKSLWRGRIFLAHTPMRRAFAIYGEKRFAKKVFEFDENLYAAKFSQEEFSKVSEGEEFSYSSSWDFFNRATSLESISNCVPEFIYVQQDKLTEERQYFFTVKKYADRRQYFGAFSGNALTDARAFNNALLNVTNGGTFDGGAGDLKILRNQWLNRNVPSVETVPYIGYDAANKIYVFSTFGYYGGRLIKTNKHDYLEAGDVGIKTTLKDIHVTQTTEFSPAWLQDFITVFHHNGLVTLAFFTASLFARQIKEKSQSFTFLELTGEPGAGKSTLLRFCWKLLGRDNHEGLDLLSTSVSSYGRHLGKVSNLPVVIIESDRDTTNNVGGRPTKAVDWDVFKKVYDLDGVIDSRGVKTNDNTTLDRIFQGTVVISQNETVSASPAMLSRIVHLHATTAHQRRENRPLADKFKTMPTEEVAGWLHHCLTNESAYLARYFKLFEKYRAHLSTVSEITHDRIIDCHAQVMAAVVALKELLPLDNNQLTEVVRHLTERAKQRQLRLNKDHPVLEQFWETYHYINDESMHIDDEDGKRDVSLERLNHSKDPGLIAIRLNEFLEHCRKRGQEVFSVNQLKELFPTSQRYPFIEYKKVRSRQVDTSTRCWVFKKHV